MNSWRMIFASAVVVLTCALSLAQVSPPKRVAAEQKAKPPTAEYTANLEFARSISADPSAPVVRGGTRSPYVERGERDSSNWLQKAFETLRKIETKDNPLEKVEPPPNALLTQVANAVMWTLLGGLLAYFGYIAIRELRIRKMGGRKAKTVLAEDEEALTLDEWLAMADDLSAAGKHREAVRCLYLACLMNYDAANVARFVRSETNWEHLARIEASPRNPAEVDFRATTRAFDQIWYGYRIDGISDVERFRNWYAAVRDANVRLKS